MANDNTEIEKEFEELKKEYKELKEEIDTETVMEDMGVSDTAMHIFNVSIAAVMIVIGIILVYKTRGIKQRSGKKIAGWILLILGALTLITHVISLI